LAAPAPAAKHGAVSDQNPAPLDGLSVPEALVWAAGAVVAFHLAYAFPPLSILILGYAIALAKLTAVRTWRQAATLGFLIGLVTAGPQLTCFWTLFGPGALALWSILGFWIAVFVVVGRLALRHFGTRGGLFVLPVIWTGLEYFRSELYHLKFSWLNAGYVLSGTELQPVLRFTGVYGAGFAAMVFATIVLVLKRKKALLLGITVIVAGLFWNSFGNQRTAPGAAAGHRVSVAGVHLELPADFQVIGGLDPLIEQHPQT